MLIIKENDEANENWLWQQDHADLPDDVFNQEYSTTIVFGIFYLDELVKDTTGSIIRSYLQQLCEMLEPWNDYYPWNCLNGIKLTLRQSSTQGEYIFGSLVVGDNAHAEEALVLSLLLEFSRQAGPCIYVKICDTDGEFILMEANEVIPEELEFPISNNRVWLTMGRIGYIPTTFYYNRGLKKEEAISFLTNDTSKLTFLLKVEEKLQTSFLRQFPISFLDDLRVVEVNILDQEISESVKENPKIVALALNHFLSGTFDVTPLRTDGPIPKSHTRFEIVVPESHLAVVKEFANSKNNIKDTLNAAEFSYEDLLGDIITSSIHDMINRKIIKTIPYKNMKGDTLINALKQNKFIPSSFSLSRANWNDFDHKEDEEYKNSALDNLTTSLNALLNEKTNFNNINDDMDDEHGSKDIAGQEIKKEDHFNHNLSNDELSDVSIDEDDFFEFFLKEGLNLSDDYLKKLRSAPAHNSSNTAQADKK